MLIAYRQPVANDTGFLIGGKWAGEHVDAYYLVMVGPAAGGAEMQKTAQKNEM